MKTGFKNPIDKSPTPDNKPKDGKPSGIWDFTHPHYDERSSCYIKGGSEYGVGHRQPVGHEGNPKQRVPCMPFGRPGTMQVDQP